MATIPGTQFAEAQPSGQTGQTLWNPPREGEGQQIAQGIEKLGAVTLNYALNVQKKEMVAEYYEKRRLIDERGWAAREAVTGDEEADKALWERTQSDFQAIASSSKYKDVNDMLTEDVNQVSPNWQHGMFMASQKIRSDNADDQLRLNYNKILENGTIDENGRIPEAEDMLGKMLALRSITKTKYDAFIASMPGDIHIARAERLISQGQNNLALLELEQTDKMDLTTEQLQQKRTLTTYAKNQAEELTTQQIQAIHQLAINNTAPDVIKNEIDGSDALTPMQKTEAWKQYNDALAVRAKTGQNPYTTTQDWNAAMEAYWKAEQGIIPDQKDVGSKYDVQWYEKIKKIAEGGGTTKDFEDSSAAKFLKELIDDFGRRYSLYQEVPVMREKAFRLLQDGIQSAKTPLTDREKKELALRIFNNLQTEPVTSAPGALETPTEKAEQLGQSLDKAVAENRAYQKAKGTIRSKTYLYTAINPKNGERIGWDGTKWIPLQ